MRASETKRMIIWTLICVLGWTMGAVAAEEGGWRSLYDGKTLKGWHPVGDGTWSVEDGVIIGRANSEKLYGLLVSDDEFRDFSVKFKFYCVKGDSGFYIRTYILPPEKAYGMQVQVGKAKSGTGGIYESYKRGWVDKPSDEDQIRMLDDDGWNDMRIDAKGGDITVYVNGEKTAELKGDPSRGVGHFALQMHSGNVMDVRFKDIEVKELPDPTTDVKVIKPGDNGEIVLTAADAKLHGPKIKVMPKKKALGWWTARDYAEWKVDVPEAGTYDVVMEWALGKESAANKFSFDIGDQFVGGKTEATKDWDTYETKKIGQMKLPAGVQTAVFIPVGRFENALLDLRSVKLVPVK